MLTCPYCKDYLMPTATGGEMCLGCGYLSTLGDEGGYRQRIKTTKKKIKSFLKLKSKPLQTKRLAAA